MDFPENILYSSEHTWIRIEENIGTIGITAFAQAELGEIVYVDLPGIGSSFEQGEVFGSVEAIKTVSDLIMPVSGEITGVNGTLSEQPVLINSAPFGDGWMVRVEIRDGNELRGLLSAEQYRKQTNA